MKKVSVTLDHCYGIKKLKTDFDFSPCNVFTIYAPNGVMKTSLANTFRDLSQGVQSQDRIWPSKQTVRKIVDESGKELPKDNVFVVEPYNQGFPTDRAEIQLFDQVNLMTPENIHLNSFMYEPILDLSAQHLKKLYTKLCALK